jgi:N-acetylmuramic acid 6-phosphate (MurNAc-6-P) etherase
MLSTCVMASLGRVKGNLMTHVQADNAKLRLRAAGIAARSLGMPLAKARHELAKRRWKLQSLLNSKGNS